MGITTYSVIVTPLGVAQGFLRGWQAIVFAVIAVVAGTIMVAGMFRGADRVTFRPEAIELPYMLGTRVIPWDQLAPNGPLRPNAATDLVKTIAIRPTRFHQTLSSLVDNRFLAETIREYVDNPHHRAQIGTTAEHDRLRQAILIAGRVSS